jgi:hypothetical protein
MDAYCIELVFEQKPQECFCNIHTIVVLPRSLDSIFCLLIPKNALLVPCLNYFKHNALVELGMPLHRDKLVFLVHTLYQAARGSAKFLDTLWILKDNIFVHLVDCLEHTSVRDMSTNIMTEAAYECILLENLLPFSTKLDR